MKGQFRLLNYPHQKEKRDMQTLSRLKWILEYKLTGTRTEQELISYQICYTSSAYCMSTLESV